MADKKAIVRDPDIQGGLAVFVGTRVPAIILLDYLAAGLPIEEFPAEYPSVSRETAVEALDEIKGMLGRVA
jgi:uncharacterized protein (DUF433 family)